VIEAAGIQSIDESEIGMEKTWPKATEAVSEEEEPPLFSGVGITGHSENFPRPVDGAWMMDSFKTNFASETDVGCD